MFRKWKAVVALTLGFNLLWVQTGAADEQPGTAAVKQTVSASSLYDDIITKEAAWISGMQLDSGAIPSYDAPIGNYNGKYKVIPYFTHFGLLGLLEKPEYAPVVRKYMDWYFAHLNRSSSPTVPDGSVFDYWIETDKQTETPTQDFDSTDSYASTFLDVVRKYAEVSKDTAYLQQHEADIHLIADAMLATQQEDGLTWAKPSYPVKYLMDNSEVYKGLQDMEWICRSVFGSEEAANHYRGALYHKRIP